MKMKRRPVHRLKPGQTAGRKCRSCGRLHRRKMGLVATPHPRCADRYVNSQVGRLYQVTLGLPDGGPYAVCGRCAALGRSVVRLVDAAGLLKLSDGWSA